jgi:hypothetical protein
MINNIPVDRSNDIDTLQEDVEVIKNDGHPNLIWDISSDLYSESRDVSTLPRDITNGYVVKLKDIFYMLGGGGLTSNLPTAQTTYKYVDGTWVEDATLGTITIYKKYHRDGYIYSNRLNTMMSGGVVSSGNTIYYTQWDTKGNGSSKYWSSSCLGQIYKYNGTTKSNEQLYFGPSDSSSYRYGSIGIAPTSSGGYKAVANAEGINDGRNFYQFNYTLNVGATSSSNFKTLDGATLAANDYDEVAVHPQGVNHAGYQVYLASKTNSVPASTDTISTNFKYYLLIVDNTTLLQTIDVPDGKVDICDMVSIGDYIYLTNKNGIVTRWSYKTLKWEKVNIGAGSLVEFDGEIHRFTGTTHTAHKLYRTAKTYAPKNTKIYLPYEASATSTNLQPIEGGFVVTESGNIELKIYDY